MAFITVSDAAGRVLFRRRATEVEIAEAVHAAETADVGAQEAMHEIAAQRYEALAAGTTIEHELEPPGELAELEDLAPLEEYGETFDEPAEEQPEPAGMEDTSLFADLDTSQGAIDPWFSEARYTGSETDEAEETE